MAVDDPLLRLAKLKLIRLSAELEVQISSRIGGSIVLEILRRWRDRAAEMMVALASTDPTDVTAIRTLQNGIMRYDEWVNDIRAILAEGKSYDQQMSEDDRNETLDVLMQSPEGQQQAIDLGLVDDPRMHGA